MTLTVGTLRAGTAANVVPESAALGIGVRASSGAALERAVAEVRRIVLAESAAVGAPREPEITVVSRSAALRCDPATTGEVRRVHAELLGSGRVLAWPGSMAAEDFPLFGDAGAALHGERGVPLAYWMLGVVGPEEWRRTAPGGPDAGAPPVTNHSPYFAPHVGSALRPAIAAAAAAALDRFARLPQRDAGRVP
ncbi:peptidase dimerization domain-containing protein [Streptomyces sanyensis]|uniref:peptidase dimerization domain-containing protein n=1 Tax=Streptomyces sanyensis TaxID=568869 RepID=UPI003D7735F8